MPQRRLRIGIGLLGLIAGGLLNTPAIAQQPRGGVAQVPPQGRAPVQGQAPVPRAAQPSRLPPMPNDPAQLQKTRELLAAWEAKSANDQNLYAEFERTDILVEETKPRNFIGKALLMRPNLARIITQYPNESVHEEIIADGKAVYHVLAPTRTVYVYPLEVDQQSRLLEEGPLPFMFNMRAEEALRRYEIYLNREVPADAENPARYYLQIRPRETIDREEFIEALVILDKETFHPIVLRLIGPNGKDTKTFRFHKVSRNDPRSFAANPASYDGRGRALALEKQGYKIIVNDPAAPAAPPGRAANAAAPGARGVPTAPRRR